MSRFVLDALELDERAALELDKIGSGAYAPLAGFMTEEEVASVVESMTLPNGEIFPLPVVLEVPGPAGVGPGDRVALRRGRRVLGSMTVRSVFHVDLAVSAERLYGTRDDAHPGVRAWRQSSGWFAGGPVEVDPAARVPAVESWPEPEPSQLRAIFAVRGWKTVAAFNTRNIPHRAHEYLHRLALEQVDGLLIHPIVGPRKRGDYRPEAIHAAYRAYIDRFLPEDRVILAPLSIPMRYAGPREAVLHALIRRNYGCTHLIVGRDHAGVGEWYGRYEARDLAERLAPKLGIGILPVAGPFHCAVCGGIVTERTCPHPVTEPEAVTEVSGSMIRFLLGKGAAPRPELIRPEVVAGIHGIDAFIEADQ